MRVNPITGETDLSLFQQALVQFAPSVDIANELSIKPPMIRIWLYRLNNLANSKTNPHRRIPKRWPPELLKLLFVLRTSGKTFDEISTVLHVGKSTVQQVWRECYGDLCSDVRGSKAVRFLKAIVVGSQPLASARASARFCRARKRLTV